MKSAIIVATLIAAPFAYADQHQDSMPMEDHHLNSQEQHHEMPGHHVEMINLKVSGMKCGNCISKLQESLVTVDGILHVDANLESMDVMMHVAPDSQLSDKKITLLVQELGFNVDHIHRFGNAPEKSGCNHK